MSETIAQRLPAAKRREAILDAALRAFAAGSFAATTTAEIAAAAGVSEPILYRHFSSKRELYLACVDEAWRRLHGAIERALAGEDDPAEWPAAIPKAVHALRDRKLLPMHFWIQALAEAGPDPVIRRHMRSHMHEVHAYFEGIMARARIAGGIASDRDPATEAWISLAIGLLRSVEDRLGGVLSAEQFAAIGATRRRWLAGAG